MFQRAPFDFTMFSPASFPDQYKLAFFNQPWVQRELGVPLNFTASSDEIVGAFLLGTGDPVRREKSALEDVLDSGINVAIMHGDRDYRCNCKLSPH